MAPTTTLPHYSLIRFYLAAQTITYLPLTCLPQALARRLSVYLVLHCTLTTPNNGVRSIHFLILDTDMGSSMGLFIP